MTPRKLTIRWNMIIIICGICSIRGFSIRSGFTRRSCNIGRVSPISTNKSSFLQWLQLSIYDSCTSPLFEGKALLQNYLQSMLKIQQSNWFKNTVAQLMIRTGKCSTLTLLLTRSSLSTNHTRKTRLPGTCWSEWTQQNSILDTHINMGRFSRKLVPQYVFTRMKSANWRLNLASSEPKKVIPTLAIWCPLFRKSISNRTGHEPQLE